MLYKSLVIARSFSFFYAVYHSLYSTGKFSQMDARTDEDEHSIEMHLPYIAKVMERLATI